MGQYRPMVQIGFGKLVLISGKGGVGKTTFSCASALHYASQNPDKTVFLLSTDPAHSLGDVLGLPVEDVGRSHPDQPNLSVRALDAERLLQDFKSRYGRTLEILVERGSFVENDDLSPIWDMNWPGLNELMGLLEIQRILRQGEADCVIVDMAPSGHTLNLFGLMDFLDTFLASLRLFQEKHRYMIETLSGQYQPDEADRFLDEMTTDLASGRGQLQNTTDTACWVVGIPEPLSVLETERFVAALKTLQIPHGGTIVNRLTGSAAQRSHLAQFEQIAATMPVLGLPLQPTEPVGTDALRALILQLNSVAAWRDRADATEMTPVWPTPVPPPLDDFMAAGKRLVLVGGKGGVGKTTVAAAIAWEMAARHPQQSVRVISIDPAHSLGDAFEATLGHAPVALTDNLTAQEIDADTVLEQFREDYLWELAEIMSGDTASDGGLQIAYGPEGWRQIVAQALPGIDEMLSLISVITLLEQDTEALIILDTAPTGHLLKFLEMPTALGEWLAWIFKLWIKYQDVIGRTEFMGRLRGLRKQAVQAQKFLSDPAHTEFIGVVQNQSAILAEAQRLSQDLQQRQVCQRYVVHNRYLPSRILPADAFPAQTVVCLPVLPESVNPRSQVEGAARLLFSAP